MDSAGVYRCTASNDVGEENCTIEVTMQCEISTFFQPSALMDGYCLELQMEIHFLLHLPFHLHLFSPQVLQHWWLLVTW